jgi:hypothetical protein
VAVVSTRRIRSTRAFRRSSTRRRSAWANASINNVALPAGGNVLHDMLESFTLASATSTMGTTIARTHFTFRWEPTNLADFIDVGLIVGTDTQEADDLNPNSAFGLPWLLLTRLYPTGADGVTVDAQSVHMFDIRAQRKMPSFDNRYVLVAHNPAGAPRNYSFYARTLLKLP